MNLRKKTSDVCLASGAEGIVVDKVSNVGDALSPACKSQREGKTTIVEMRCTRELVDPFRRDALKLPLRTLDKYKNLSWLFCINFWRRLS